MPNLPVSSEAVTSISPSEIESNNETAEKLPAWDECMSYGSERFENATANNHNIVVLVEAPIAQKVVLGKDVVLTLPKDPESLDVKAGYPTHQEAWLPMWYIVAYHSQAKTPQEREYQRQVLESVSDEAFTLVRSALAYKAQQFFQEYKETIAETPLSEVENDPKAIRKRYKPMTRVLQDIMLYSDLPRQPIESHESFLGESPIFDLINRANGLRRGENLETASGLEAEVETLITSFVQECGGPEKVEQAYTQLREQIEATPTGSVYLVDAEVATIEDGPLYAHLVNPALTLAMDEHDHDVVSIVPGLEEPRFFQIEERFGDRLTKSRRLDVIAIPEDIGPYDLLQGGKESFQSIAMMVITHTTANSEGGTRLQERLEKEFSPKTLAQHYLGAAKEFMDGHAWGKSYAVRSESSDIPQVKKSIPLHRVGRDLLPRAIYMMKTGEFPYGVEDEKLWEETGLSDVAAGVERIWEKQNATDDELKAIADRIKEVLGEYYTDECGEVFESNLERMGTDVGIMRGLEHEYE